MANLKAIIVNEGQQPMCDYVEEHSKVHILRVYDTGAFDTKNWLNGCYWLANLPAYICHSIVKACPPNGPEISPKKLVRESFSNFTIYEKHAHGCRKTLICMQSLELVKIVSDLSVNHIPCLNGCRLAMPFSAGTVLHLQLSWWMPFSVLEGFKLKLPCSNDSWLVGT